jgi:hypothetical protein
VKITVDHHVYHHDAPHPAQDHKLDHLVNLGEKMADELKHLQEVVAGIKSDADALKASSDNATAKLDDLKARLVALAAQAAPSDAAALVAIASDLGGVSAELKGTKDELDAAAVRAALADVTVLAAAAVGQAYDVVLPLPGATADLVAGNLPDGLTVVGRNVSGTPQRAGDFAFSAQGKDGSGNAVGSVQSFVITVS